MNEEQEIEKKQKTWGSGGGMYRGVNVPVKMLNYIIVILMVIKIGDSIEIEKPQKAGYTFVGWYLDQDLKHQWNPDKQKVEQSMTLYASWKPNKINVIFDYDGGNELIQSKEVVYNDTYGKLPQPTKEGYQFLGWIYSGEVITGDTIVTVNGEHVLKALWQSQ